MAGKLDLEIFIFKECELVDTTTHPAIHNITTPHHASLGLIGYWRGGLGIT